jgi:hypothetical protein
LGLLYITPALILADKAYSARASLDAVAENGGIAYIP